MIFLCCIKDSLDGGVAIRFGIKEPDDTISLDSLLEVEEYQVRFEDPADAEQVFRSLDGFIDVRYAENLPFYVIQLFTLPLLTTIACKKSIWTDILPVEYIFACTTVTCKQTRLATGGKKMKATKSDFLFHSKNFPPFSCTFC